MENRALARKVYALSGRLYKIRVPARYFRRDPATGEFTRACWRRGGCGLALRLLGLSERLDPAHWEHWALKHDDRAPRCPECGGGIPAA